MKISSLQENIKQGLFVVSHIAGKNVNLPILNNVMFDASDGDLKMITTDLEIGIISRVRGKIEQPGAYTVDAKIIADYINLLPNQKVEIKQKNNSLLIECGNYKTKIKGQPADDYPLIPKIEKNKQYLINPQELRSALAQVLFAVSNSETRLELTGVLFVFGKDLTLAATDSYRLAERTIKLKAPEDSQSESQKIIIPAKTLLELLRILSNFKDAGPDENQAEVNCYVSENQVMFAINNMELISRLIEGQYPDYTQIIPNNNKTKAVINKIELVRAVKAASLFSKAGINDINLDFPQGKNTLVISSASDQAGENTCNLEAQVEGSDNGVVVNCRYLLDGLNNIDSEEIIFETVDANTPCTIRPANSDQYLYIVMPIKQ